MKLTSLFRVNVVQRDHEALLNMKTKFMDPWDGFTTGRMLKLWLQWFGSLDLCKKVALRPLSRIDLEKAPATS
ncbi:hypothetical protein ACSQ67_003022 [Phaseolus vulgaris]